MAGSMILCRLSVQNFCIFTGICYTKCGSHTGTAYSKCRQTRTTYRHLSVYIYYISRTILKETAIKSFQLPSCNSLQFV